MAHRTVPNNFELDAVAWKILEALQQNARQSFAEIARQVGLSTPAVAERVHRLEEAGVITGYHVALDIAKLGLPIRVLVRLTIPGGDLQVPLGGRYQGAGRDLQVLSHNRRRILCHRGQRRLHPPHGSSH